MFLSFYHLCFYDELIYIYLANKIKSGTYTGYIFGENSLPFYDQMTPKHSDIVSPYPWTKYRFPLIAGTNKKTTRLLQCFSINITILWGHVQY